jgi:hypothetical protein
MKLKKEKVCALYRRLICLYPRGFRERFGESMEKTFGDVCNEESRLKGGISLPFVVSTVGEISAGIFKENLGELIGADRANYWLKNIFIAGIISLFLSLLFTFGTYFSDNPQKQLGEFSFPVSDFLRGWLIQTIVFTLIVSGLRSGESVSAKNLLATLAAAVLFGVLLIAPFAFMEYWNNPVVQSGESPFPVMLFIGLWLTPVMFFLGATPIVRSVRSGASVLAHPAFFVLRLIFLALLAVLWLNLIRDQMPCFLGGVPGCD